MKTLGKSDPPQARKPYMPLATQNRILEEHLNGKSNRQIAKITGRDRGTVSRTISQSEVPQLIAQSRLQMLSFLPKAMAVLEGALDSNDERTRLAAAMRLLECSQVLPKNGLEIPMPKDDSAHRRLLLYGQMLEMVIHKHHNYGIDLPPGCEGIEKEAKRKLEGPSPDTTSRP